VTWRGQTYFNPLGELQIRVKIKGSWRIPFKGRHDEEKQEEETKGIYLLKN